MPNFAANLTLMFNEVEFLDRFEAAARAGFTGVEYLFPYDFDKTELADRLASNGLTQALHNLPAGDWGAGERGIAILPDRVAEFRASVDTAIEYARALNCERVNCLAGLTPPGADPAVLRETLVENLAYAAERLKGENIKLVVEAINTRDIPGFFLNGSRQTLDILKETGSDNIYFQYDIYHMQIMEGDLAPTIRENLSRIAHIQLADTPGRHEPGTGEINYPFLFAFIDEIGYQGWIGCEYNPRDDTVGGLGWFEPYRNGG